MKPVFGEVKRLKRTLLVSLLFVQLGLANTQLISYTGGKQSGTFAINASGGQARGSYPDTVAIDSILKITQFLAIVDNYAQQCYLRPAYQYGLALQVQNGLVGKLGKEDTVWNNARLFRDTLQPLDTVPKAGYAPRPDLGNPPGGINIDTVFTNGVCSPFSFALITGYHNVLYFKFNHGSGVRYGKLMFYGYHFVSGFVSGSVNPPIPTDYTTLTVAYTISSTQDLDSGPVVGISQRKLTDKSRSQSGDQYFDLNGRTQKIQNPDFPPLPFLPKP